MNTDSFSLLLATARKSIALCEKLKVIHEDPRYQSVWQISQIHVGPYSGPTYEVELKALVEALEQLGISPFLRVRPDANGVCIEGGASAVMTIPAGAPTIFEEIKSAKQQVDQTFDKIFAPVTGEPAQGTAAGAQASNAGNPNEAKIAERAPADNLTDFRTRFQNFDRGLLAGFVFGAFAGFCFSYTPKP